jgi:hypothetical protein
VRGRQRGRRAGRLALVEKRKLSCKTLERRAGGEQAIRLDPADAARR